MDKFPNMNNFTDEPTANISPVRIQLDHRGWITRKYIGTRHDCVFVYGHDFIRSGMSGQAYELNGEVNAFPVFTVYKLCPSGKHYFDDGTFDLYAKIIDQSIEALPRDSRPIIPLPKIGTGGSQLKQKAPKLYAHLWRQLNRVCYQNIIWEMPTAGLGTRPQLKHLLKDWLL